MAYKLGPKMPTGSTQPQEFEFYGFRGGLNIKGAGQLIGDEDLTVGYNGYLRPDGAFQFRNGMSTYGTTQAGTNMLILARFYQDIQGAVVQTPETVKLLGQFGNTLYSIPSAGAWTSIGTVGSLGTPQGMTFVRIQNPNCSTAGAPGTHSAFNGLTDCMVICTGSGGPYIYDGTNLYVPPGWASAANASYCEVVNGILWFGGISAFPNQIFGTGDGIIQSMETLPAIRNFVMSSYVFGLRAQGSGATASLVVGINSGISVLYGTGPSTFYKQDIPFSGGVVSGRSMCVDQGVMYFMGHDAAYEFDGQTIPKAISQKVEPWILNDPIIGAQQFQYPMTLNGALTWGAIYNNRLHFGYCSTTTTPNSILVYDLTLKGWTVLQTAPGLACFCPLDAPSDANPSVMLAGSATTGQAYTWDAVPAFTSALGNVLDGASVVIGMVQSKYFKLGEPGTNKMLLRFYPEFLVGATPFQIPFLVSTDYGNSSTTILIDNAMVGINTGLWDQGLWDVALWGATGFSSFNAPASRVDLNTPGEAFAFGAQMNGALPPWIFSGGSGAFSQKSRT